MTWLLLLLLLLLLLRAYEFIRLLVASTSCLAFLSLVYSLLWLLNFIALKDEPLPHECSKINSGIYLFI